MTRVGLGGRFASWFQPEEADASRRLAMPIHGIRTPSILAGDPQDVAGPVCLLGSEESGYIPGRSLNMCGGISMTSGPPGSRSLDARNAVPSEP
jgi:hypothetical protein